MHYNLDIVAIDEAVMDAWDDMLDMQEIWEDHCEREAV